MQMSSSKYFDQNTHRMKSLSSVKSRLMSADLLSNLNCGCVHGCVCKPNLIGSTVTGKCGRPIKCRKTANWIKCHFVVEHVTETKVGCQLRGIVTRCEDAFAMRIMCDIRRVENSKKSLNVQGLSWIFSYLNPSIAQWSENKFHEKNVSWHSLNADLTRSGFHVQIAQHQRVNYHVIVALPVMSLTKIIVFVIARVVIVASMKRS